MKRHKQKQQITGGAGLPAPSSIPAPEEKQEPDMMRVRMLKPAATVWGFMAAGRAYAVPRKAALGWIAVGLAEEDKSLDGAQETK